MSVFKAVFYITGGFSILWCILWWVLLSDEPRDHKCIGQAEIDYIQSHRILPKKPQNAKGDPILPPYWQILTTHAVITTILCDFANGWGLTTILVDGPNFISNVLNKDIQDVSLKWKQPNRETATGKFMLRQGNGHYIPIYKSHKIRLIIGIFHQIYTLCII